MTTLMARAITPAARAWLAAARPARILGVFERTCNLVDEAGAVLTLAGPGVGLTPFGLAVTGEARPFHALTAHSPVRIAGGVLRVGRLSVTAAGAATWDPRPDWAGVRAALAARPDRLDRALDLALAIGKPGSLLEITHATPLPLAASRGEGALSPLAVEDQGVAWGAVLVHGLRSRSLDQALAGAHALAGLGGGLTPAGDDFIVGALLAAWAGVLGHGAEALAGPIAAAAAPRTTTLSGAYLRAAAQGACAEHWHRVFAALATDDDAELEAALRRLLAVGHTSGADALAGFLMARTGVIP